MKQNHDINDLRRILFETIQDVKEGKTDAAQAKLIGDLSQTIINSAKVEVDYAKAVEGVATSGFMQSHPEIGAPVTAYTNKAGQSAARARLRQSEES